MGDHDEDTTPTHEALERLGLGLLAVYVLGLLLASHEEVAFLAWGGGALLVLGLVGRMMRE